MAYKVEFTQAARKDFAKLGAVEQKQVQAEIKKIEALENPRNRGEALQGAPRLWRYRTGDLRIITKIDDGLLVISAVKIAQRGSVYKR